MRRWRRVVVGGGILALLIYLILQFGVGGGWGLFPGRGPGSGTGTGTATGTGTGTGTTPPAPGPKTSGPAAGKKARPAGEAPRAEVRFVGTGILLDGRKVADLEAFRAEAERIQRTHPETVFALVPEKTTPFGQVERVEEILDRLHLAHYPVDPRSKDE